jgi:sugar phosphate permease
MGTVVVFSSLGLGRFSYTMLLPSMQKSLELSNSEAGWIATGNLIGYLGLALIGGFLASHYSPKKVISIALSVVGLSMILTGTASKFVPVIIYRTLTGMGSGASNVPVMGLIAAWFAPRRRGLASGIVVTGSSIAVILTGWYVPKLLDRTDESGWQYGWILLGVIVLFTAILTWFILRDKPSDKGCTRIGENNDSTKNKIPPDNKNGEKQSCFHVYKSPVVRHLALIYATFGFSYIIFVTYLAKYLQEEMGYSREAAGHLWQIVGWISIFCGLLWGWLSDITGRKYGLALVSFIQGVCYLTFALWKCPTGMMVSTVLFGLTAWSIPAIMAATCGDMMGSRLAPAALGFVTLIFGIAQACGPFVAGIIADKKGSFTLAFILAGIVAILGSLISLALKDEDKQVKDYHRILNSRSISQDKI